MSEPPETLTPVQVARFLMGLSRRLDELVGEYAGLGRKAAEAKRDAAQAEAKAFLETMPAPGQKRTVDERRSLTVLACSDELFLADLAVAQLNACREAIRAVTLRIDVGRTLSATSRAEMQNFGGGP